jgi:hypothetical protein
MTAARATPLIASQKLKIGRGTAELEGKCGVLSGFDPSEGKTQHRRAGARQRTTATGRRLSMPRTSLALSLVLAILTLAPAAIAGSDTGDVEIHGYGGWSYGRSNADANRYLASSEDGDARYVSLAIALASCPSDRVRISTQVWWEAEPGEEESATVDCAFAEWRVSDALRLRMGQVKHPYGIYTEVFDVGTIRPFFWLPQSVYGPSGTVAESYRGVGLTGSVFAAGIWRFEYDLYGGEMSLEAQDIAAVFATEEDSSGTADAEAPGEGDIRDLVGGRLTITVPGPEVRIGLSAYTGREKGSACERHSCLGAHVEYLSDTWSLRSEYTLLKESAKLPAAAAYVEVARRLGSSWQIAGRVDHSDTRLEDVDASAAPSLLDHLDITAGLNYWFHPDFVVKLSSSRVDGNRFAWPEDEDIRAAIAGDGIRRQTRLVSLGVQFAF